MNEFDDIDMAIVDLLQKDARLSNKEIAAEIGIAQSTCSERMRKLKESKVFKGFHAFVDAGQLGTNLQAIVSIKLQRHSNELVQSFKQKLIGNKEVINVYYMAGGSDFLVHVAVVDTRHLQDFVMENITSQGLVQYVDTSIIYEYINNPCFPIY